MRDWHPSLEARLRERYVDTTDIETIERFSGPGYRFQVTGVRVDDGEVEADIYFDRGRLPDRDYPVAVEDGDARSATLTIGEPDPAAVDAALDAFDAAVAEVYGGETAAT